MRVKIFVDFWNFQLGWRDYHREQGETGIVSIPWEGRLQDVLTASIGEDALYAGTHVYASIDPKSEKDRGLRRFLHAMDGFPGYSVTVKERKARGPLHCPNPECRRSVDVCPHCNEQIRRTIEKGIDAALVIDLIQQAMDDVYDRAILLSSDADFVPAVQFLQKRMKQVTHIGFRGYGSEIRNACWDHRHLEDLIPKLFEPEDPD